MKVSIVIPVYNVFQYLEECVKSVRKLSIEIEVLLVDDGSTDGSGALCDKLAAEDSRIQVIHQKNGGLSAARNTGIRNCTGDYILFLDSDDFLDVAETEKLLSYCSSRADVIMGLYRNFYTEQNRYESENSPAFLKMNGLVSAETFLNAIPADGQTCHMVAVRFVVRRSLLLESALLFLPGIYHEDEEWTQRLLCKVDSVFVSHAWFYQYRQARIGSITSIVRPKSVWDTVTVMENALREREMYQNVAYKKQYLSHRAAQNYLIIMLKSEVLNKDDKKKLWRVLNDYRDRCVPYLCGTMGKLARVLIGFFGVSTTCALLQNIRNVVRVAKSVVRGNNQQ